jgi:hypothetical protein
VDASSEPDSLPFFGRAAGIETARKKASQGEGEGKPRRRRAVVIITVAKVADGFIGTGAQDFEQSRSNHGWPRVALGARFGHSLWIFPKIQYQVQIRPLVFEKFCDTTTRHEMTLPPIDSSQGAERADSRMFACSSPIQVQGHSRWIGLFAHFRPSHHPQLLVAHPAIKSTSLLPALVHHVYITHRLG